jgi:hypothetical protein
MKRCPQCNRVESDEALKFCRVDGATLVGVSSPIDSEAGTVQLASPATEINTNELPDGTAANINRATAPTTVLPSPATFTDVRITYKYRPNKIAIVVIGTLIIVAVTAAAIIWYRTGSRRAAINSIAVMPFVNESGNTDVDYLSDGMTETLIRSLSQLPSLNVKSRSSVFRYKGRSPDAETIGLGKRQSHCAEGVCRRRLERFPPRIEGTARSRIRRAGRHK